MSDFTDIITHIDERSFKVRRVFKTETSVNQTTNIEYPKPGVKVTTTIEETISRPIREPEEINVKGLSNIEGSVFDFGGFTGVIAFSGERFHMLSKQMHHIVSPSYTLKELIQLIRCYPNPIYKGNISDIKVRCIFFA